MISVQNLSVQVGSFRLERISFEIATGTYGMLMGKTGSGKTTLLEALAGLQRIADGRVYLDGRDVTRLRPAQRNIGYVPQDGALFSTMTVREHLAFALTIRRVAQPEIDQRVDELAELLEIKPLLSRYPQGLSGGEQQRVAIGRALSFRPAILVLDEPLSALDDDTRRQLYSLLKHVQQQTRVTTLHVTHHWQDVEHLADELLRLDQGRVVRQAVPRAAAKLPSADSFFRNHEEPT